MSNNGSYPTEMVYESDADFLTEEVYSLPLSFAQQRLWFLDQLQPGVTAYNVPGALRLRGPLNQQALEQSLNEIVARHESLRTVFSVVDGQPVQWIRSSLSIEVGLTELEGATVAAREAEVRRLGREEAARAFDLEAGPLLRARLLRLSEREHVLLLTMHHIVSDGWSLGVLVRELCALYEAFSQGGESGLAPLAVQYADYAQWQRERLVGEVLEQQLQYWREQLAGAPALLELPADRARPAVQSFRGAQKSVRLGAELTAALKELSRAEGVTLFMTLLAGFAVLLWRYTGERDVMVGTPVANRGRREVEGLIGFFVNTLSLRLQVAGEESFAETLRRVREVCLGGYGHQEVPFERVVEELGVERRLSQSPLFQVMFALQNAPLPPMQLSGLEVELLEVEVETAKFDLNVSLGESEGELRGVVEYSTDLFERETIERFTAHYVNLLEHFARHPEQRLREVPVLSAPERVQLLQWNRMPVEHVEATCVHELFEQQARQTPEAVALVYEHETFCYAELNARANQLAGYLRRCGVGPESLVGILMERSLELVVALVGVLKAGAAYMPLDPDYPAERLAYMVSDAGASVVLTQERLSSVLPGVVAEQRAKVICVDRDWPEIARESAEDQTSGAAPDNLAYVIYTSGSTGRPKGVQVTHENVSRLFSATHQWFDFQAQDVWTLFHSFAFDFSVWEIWGALLYGGRLVIVPYWVSRSPDEFYALLVREGVTVLNQTPSAFRQLLQAEERLLEGEERMLEAGSALVAELALRFVIFGGEALDAAGLSGWLERHGEEQPQLINMYGITETTVHVTYRRIGVADAVRVGAGSVIGGGIPDLQVYVLDEFQQLAPVGVKGELYVGGAGVARGYLQRAELTAERFVPDPFAGAGGGRLYRSGDEARWLRSGELEYLGRVDQQVKVRGHRIELGEVETVLSEHAGVREAVAVVREDGVRGARVVAYVVGAGVSSRELREWAREKLPEYMVPQAVAVLEELPLLPNGKVDRKQLPAVELVGEDEAQLEARTPIEELVCGIWAEVLGLERVGVHDDFFELGGHSLLTTQVASRINQVFQIELPVRTLFEQPTIAELAPMIEKQLSETAPVAWLPLRPQARNDSGAPLSFAQQRLWFLDQLQPGVTAYNVPGALRLRGPLNQQALEQSLNEIVARHESLRTVFSVVDGQPVQWIRSSLSIRLGLTELEGATGEAREEEVRRLGREEAARAFDLEAGPLLRARLLRLSESEHVLLLTMHHIVSDGWSLGVLVRELCALYETFSQGGESGLAPLVVQYADYAQWQRERLVGEVLEQQLQYWREQLAGAPALLELPADRARPAVQSFRGAQKSVRLGAELTAALKELSRAEGVTLFMTLLAGFAVLLWRYTGERDVMVGTPVANRGRREVESLIGFFVNTLSLRLRVAGEESFAETLRRVREVCLGGYAHQEVPFERVVEEMGVERRLSQSPLFQVMFTLQNAPLPPMQLSGLEVELLEVEVETAKFDLTVWLTESEGELRGLVEYSTDLFERETIERFTAHYLNLLEAVVRQPDTSLSQLPLLSANERRQQLAEWNDTETEYDRALCVHDLFEAQAILTPDIAAAVCEGVSLSYAELNARANQLAHYLRRHGVGPESLVGILMERSLEMLVAVLGTLKTGAAYVPLDPAHPRYRFSFMLEDANASVLLTQQSLTGVLPEQQAKVICLDRDWVEIARESVENRASGVTQDNLAYVIYTSGSTGRPKGVSLSHLALANLIAWHASVLPEPTNTMQFASLNFDVSFHDMFSAWHTGGTVFVVPEEQRVDVEALGRFIREQQIQRATLPVVVLQQLAERFGAQPDVLSSLKVLIAAGEQLQITVSIIKLFERLNQCRLLNYYGPSETHVVTAFTLAAEPASWQSHPPIGTPIANTQTYILDEQMNLVPTGVVDELYLGGVCLARGYLNRPALTAEKFLPNPFSAEPGTRLYKTGDRARYLPDGNIEFLGRKDHQVKIRGFRVEMGEIESVLGQHPGVLEVVVIPREDVPGENRLAAYIVPELPINPLLRVDELRKFVEEKLPGYMVPSDFVMMEQLPLNVNGKIERRALPAPDLTRPNMTVEFVAPRNPAEEVVAGIWKQILHRERIGVNDSFFALGGHSLLATQSIFQIRTALQIEQLAVRNLFEAPTVAGLVETIAGHWGGLEVVNEIARTWQELERLSADEVEEMLIAQTAGN